MALSRTGRSSLSRKEPPVEIGRGADDRLDQLSARLRRLDAGLGHRYSPDKQLIQAKLETVKATLIRLDSIFFLGQLL